MEILPQSTSLSHTRFPLRTDHEPPMLMLPAQPERKLLCAPQIAGLLPARAALPLIEVTFAPSPIFKRLTRKEIEGFTGPLRTKAELDAEIEALIQELFFDSLSARKNGQP